MLSCNKTWMCVKNTKNLIVHKAMNMKWLKADLWCEQICSAEHCCFQTVANKYRMVLQWLGRRWKVLETRVSNNYTDTTKRSFKYPTWAFQRETAFILLLYTGNVFLWVQWQNCTCSLTKLWPQEMILHRCVQELGIQTFFSG